MKAMVLAAGFPQIALIQELKKRNIEVVLADYNAEPVAKPYADKYYQESTLDVPKIKKIAVSEAVDFLITVCTDQALLTVAKVSEDLGLPCYIDYKTALNVTNKQYMKDVFMHHGIPTSKYVILKEFDESKIKGFRYPLIVKPVDCNSSKGVRRCDNLEELKEFFSAAAKMSRTDTAIIEEFIEGKELSADFYISDGKANLLSVSQSNKIAEKDKFVIFRAVFPPACSKGLESQIQQIGQKIADAFGIKNSPMLVQLLTDGKDLDVIEFSARTGGGIKYLLIKHISGFDVINAVVDLTLGNHPECDVKASATKYLVNDFIYCKPGTFDRLVNFEEMKEQGYLKDFYLFKWKGAKFDSINNSGDRVAGYTVTADSLDELINKHNIVRANIRVEDSNGTDIARHDLLTDLDRAEFQ